MRVRVGLLVVMVVAGVIAGVALWQRGRVPELQRQRDALRATVDKTEGELARLLKQAEATDAVATARRAADAAKAAYQAKIANSPTIAQAKHAADIAAMDYKATIDEQLAADPTIATAAKAADAADDAAFDAESDLRVARFVLTELARGVGRAADFQPLQSEKLRTEEAIYEARQLGTSVDAAKAARDAAARALDDAVNARLSTLPAGQAQQRQVADLEAKAAALRAAHVRSERHLAAVREHVLETDPRIVRAADAAEEARLGYRATLDAETDAERAALEEARAAVEDAVRATVQADPKAVELNNQLNATLAQIIDVDARIDQVRGR